MKNIIYCVIDYVVSLSEEFTAQLIFIICDCLGIFKEFEV